MAKAATGKLQSDEARERTVNEDRVLFKVNHGFQRHAYPASGSQGTHPHLFELDIFRIAVNDAATMVPEASPGAGAAGTFSAFAGRRPLLEAIDGAGCGAIHHRVFYKYNKPSTWVLCVPRHA